MYFIITNDTIQQQIINITSTTLLLLFNNNNTGIANQSSTSTTLAPACQDYSIYQKYSINKISQVLLVISIVQTIVIITGILLNILNIVVLLNSKLNESPYTYLTALAFSDLFSLIAAATLPYVRKLIKASKNKSLLHFVDLYIDLPVNNILLSYSIYITLALTIERFIFVTSPFKAVSICRKSIARKVCVCVAAVSIAKSVYLPFMYKKSPCDLTNYEQYKSPVLDIFQFLIDLAIPYFIIFIINITLILSLKKKYNTNMNSSVSFQNNDMRMLPTSKSTTMFDNDHNGENNGDDDSPVSIAVVQRQQSCETTYRRTSNEKEARNQRKLTRSLIAILCCLLVCHLPNFLLEESIIENLVGNHYESERAFILRTIGWRVSLTLLYVNCTANFIIYCISNKKFSTSSKLLFRRIKHKLTYCFRKSCCCSAYCLAAAETPTRGVGVHTMSSSIYSNRFSSTKTNYKRSSSKLSFRTAAATTAEMRPIHHRRPDYA